MKLKSGDLVRIRAYPNELQIRRLLAVEGRTAIITTDKERESAIKTGRRPISVGIPVRDVVEVLKGDARSLQE